MPQVSMRCSTSCGMMGSRLNRPLVSFVCNKYLFMRTKGLDMIALDLLSRCTDAGRKHNMKTQLLLMTSLQSPTLWQGFTFGGHIDRYCERTANVRPCGFRSTYRYFLGLPYTKGYD